MAKSAWAPEVLFVLLLAAFWIGLVAPIVVTEKRRGGDIVRDAAAALNVQQGLWLADPAYRGELVWYPPLSPILVAGICSVVGLEPLEVYRWSGLLFNWLIPAGMFLVLRLGWGLRVAVLGTVAMLLAMPWWQCEVIQAQPSIHAVVWGWVAVLLYARQHQRASLGWAAACGVWQGISFWHHPVVPAVLTGAFILLPLWVIINTRRGRESLPRYLVQRHLLIVGLTLIIALPALYLMLYGPTLNHFPREYLAHELQTVEFALMRGNPWLWCMGLAGLALCARRKDVGSRLLLISGVICILAQLPGYLRLYGPSWSAGVPVVVPHEFQRLFQLIMAVTVAIGADSLIQSLARRYWAGSPAIPAVLTVVALLITGAWGLWAAPQQLRRFVHPPTVATQDAAAAWIRQHTGINDVFVCSPGVAFEWVGPRTGRKVWLTRAGHSNPRVDWERRADVLEELALTTSPQRFGELLLQSGIDYCLLSPDWHPAVLADPVLNSEVIPRFVSVAYQDGGVWLYRVNK